MKIELNSNEPCFKTISQAIAYNEVKKCVVKWAYSFSDEISKCRDEFEYINKYLVVDKYTIDNITFICFIDEEKNKWWTNNFNVLI